MAVLGQTGDSAQKEDAANEGKTWQGKLFDGTLLTQGKLKELLAAHKLWLQTASEKLAKELEKRNVKEITFAFGPFRPVPNPDWVKDWGKEENENAWLTGLLASDWGTDEGRLLLKGAELIGANLQEADLQGANLQGTVLFNADLQGATLDGANLKEAILAGGNLKKATLVGANLQEATLVGANLQEADLWNANLKKATLSRANLKETRLKHVSLQGADLENANLQGAVCSNTNLKEAELKGANLLGTLYEPKPGALPNILGLRSAKNLETMRFVDSPYGMQDLKWAFQNAGFKEQERAITYAIKRSEQRNAWEQGEYLESSFNHVFFNLPVAYGLYPGRPLRIGGNDVSDVAPIFLCAYSAWSSRDLGRVV